MEARRAASRSRFASREPAGRSPGAVLRRRNPSGSFPKASHAVKTSRATSRTAASGRGRRLRAFDSRRSALCAAPAANCRSDQSGGCRCAAVEGAAGVGGPLIRSRRPSRSRLPTLPRPAPSNIARHTSPMLRSRASSVNRLKQAGRVRVGEISRRCRRMRLMPECQIRPPISVAKRRGSSGPAMTEWCTPSSRSSRACTLACRQTGGTREGVIGRPAYRRRERSRPGRRNRGGASTCWPCVARRTGVIGRPAPRDAR